MVAHNTIRHWELNEGKRFTLYTVTAVTGGANPEKLTVRKRYSEFDGLHTALKAAHPWVADAVQVCGLRRWTRHTAAPPFARLGEGGCPCRTPCDSPPG